MSKRSRNGSKVQTDLSLSQKTHLRALAFTLTTHDLALANAVQIIGNSCLVEGGPVGVIVFIPNATVGDDDMIQFPLVTEPEVQNAPA
jgi:hypothetical protein